MWTTRAGIRKLTHGVFSLHGQTSSQVNVVESVTCRAYAVLYTLHIHRATSCCVESLITSHSHVESEAMLQPISRPSLSYRIEHNSFLGL